MSIYSVHMYVTHSRHTLQSSDFELDVHVSAESVKHAECLTLVQGIIPHKNWLSN